MTSINTTECPICQGRINHAVRYTDGVDFYNCSNCKFVYRIPTENLVDYRNDYVLENNHLKAKRLSNDYIKELRDNISNNSSVLEVGGSYGYFLEELKKQKNCKILNYELSKDAINYCTRKNIEATDDISRIKQEQFDYIFCFHVIEHIEIKQLHNFLTSFLNQLKNGGKFILFTPNGNSTLFRFLGKFYPWIAFPEHTLFLSEKSIKNICKKINIKRCTTYSRIPAIVHYPTFSILAILRRRLSKIDQDLLNRKRNISSKNNTTSNNSSIKKLFRLLVRYESYLYLPLLLLISVITDEKEELVIVIEK